MTPQCFSQSKEDTLRVIFFWFVIAVFTGSCDSNHTGGKLISIISQRTLENIPSGSGIVVHKDMAYIIGDDATGIYQLDFALNRETKIPVAGMDSATYREAKADKHDFESATLVDWNGQLYLLGIGSGSKSVTRDSALLLNVSNHSDYKIFSLQVLYEQLRRQTQTDVAQWNIEGVAVAGKKMILANRGNNGLYILQLNEFLEWVQNPGTKFPSVDTYKVKLPTIKDKEARLSGLCTVNDTELLFCASVEDTPDWVSDGPILGSIIGNYLLSKKAVGSTFLLQDKDGKPLLEKIESLDLLGESKGKTVNVIAIGDNDNGSTELFKLQIGSAGDK